MNSKHLSIVIPAYNESARIGKTLNETITYLDARPYESEIIVVSDGSADDTRSVCERSLCHFPAWRVIEYFPNRGKGYAVRTGMLEATGKHILFMDADYSVPIMYVEKALEMLSGGYDLAIASRAIEGARLEKRQSFLREKASMLYTSVQNRWIGVDFADTQCGFKIYKREIARILFEQQKLSSVIFDGEILYLARRAGMKIGEFPVFWSHDPDSRITYNFARSIKIFTELFKIRWLHRFGR